MIDVVYLDGTESSVSNDVLDVLIATEKIIRFKRSDGWVDIVRQNASLRDYRKREAYNGQERRAPWPRKI
ncbi:hypothetical protein SAMN05660420_02628 [Desulfuromusa kysingii]|uniref:Uncharacterized protein n=1 Tax=Desulfuromusa kysingii TaxID=37625 RepID=A0A1H4CMZ6_9BACT|nr:hypothetical protein [Desulfuromusa kysingii]SEA61700.1 hypothetical protein SAMN05660420_02628 [Desulfuromusa kysingii]